MYFPTSMSCFLVLCSITDQCDSGKTKNRFLARQTGRGQRFHTGPLKRALKFVNISCMTCFIEFYFCEKIVRKCSSEIVNNFECVTVNSVFKKIEPRILAHLNL